MSIKTSALSSASSLDTTDSVVVNTSSGTQKATISVVQTAMLPVIHSGGVPRGSEISDTWATIQTQAKAGTFTGKIGDYKTISLTTGETVILEVAGIDQYYRCGATSIGHHIDFISRDCLATQYQYNSTATNNGTSDEPNPWLASELYTALNDETSGVYATLPSDLQAVVIQKTAYVGSRYSSSGAIENSTTWVSNDLGYLWLPTEVEVWGCCHWGDETWDQAGAGLNKQYPIFMGSNYHVIKGLGNGGSRTTWWTSTPRKDSSTYFCGVSGDGIAYRLSATYSGAVPLCCRVG